MRHSHPNRLGLKALLFLVVALLMIDTVQAQDIRVKNTSIYQGKGRTKWTIYIEANASVLREIDYVKYRLDPAYGEKAIRYIREPRTGRYPFSTSDFAFEPSTVSVTVYFKNRSYRRLPDYTLKLASNQHAPPKKKSDHVFGNEFSSNFIHSASSRQPDVRSRLALFRALRPELFPPASLFRCFTLT